MLRGIDHLVIVVPDLAVAIACYEDLGFTVVPGGRHPIGTHNALIGFADGSYLELIAFHTPNPHHRWSVMLGKGGGLVDMCLQTDDLAADTAAFRRAGIAIDDPRPLSRARPDGYTVRWVLCIPAAPFQGLVPFLIQDETPRSERVPAQTAHENGVTGIGTLTMVTADLEAARRWYGDALGQAGQTVSGDDLDAAGVRFTIGLHTVEIVSPRGGTGPLAEVLGERGATPYAATLRTSGARTGPLDPAKTLGARLDLV